MTCEDFRVSVPSVSVFGLSAVIALLRAGISGDSHSPDLSAIPAIALDRLEVLRHGASAQYRSDAVAGIMNFVLKANAEGAILDAKWGSHIEGDGDVSFYPRPSVPGDGEVAGLIYPGAILVQLQRRLLLLPGNLETHFREPWERGRKRGAAGDSDVSLRRCAMLAG